jgi:hypothetical protein
MVHDFSQRQWQGSREAMWIGMLAPSLTSFAPSWPPMFTLAPLICG